MISFVGIWHMVCVYIYVYVKIACWRIGVTPKSFDHHNWKKSLLTITSAVRRGHAARRSALPPPDSGGRLRRRLANLHP